jgi:low affinity Fe/Cu permease
VALATRIAAPRLLVPRSNKEQSRSVVAAISGPVVAYIVVWAPSIAFFGLDTWPLIINTATNLTFLLVALLQNSDSQ